MPGMAPPRKKRRSSLTRLPANKRRAKALELVKEYAAKHGCDHLARTDKYRGFHIKHWVTMQRVAYRQGTLPKWLQKELEAIPGWTWPPKDDLQRHKLKVLREFVKKQGWEELTSQTKFRGVNLGMWVHNRRQDFRKGTLPDWLRVELEKIPGWVWKQKRPTFFPKEEQALEALPRFIAKHGWRRYRTNTIFEGNHIGTYVKRWRTAYRRGKLSERHIEALESIPGWGWESTVRRERHRRALKLLQDFVAKNGWDNLNRDTQVDGLNLGSWCYLRRRQYKHGELADWLVEELEAIPGWEWRM